jgi:hypothetical protein
MKHRGVLHSIPYSAAPSRYIYFYNGGNCSWGRAVEAFSEGSGLLASPRLPIFRPGLLAIGAF